ncbi:MAG: hypothetical protein Q4E75_04000 [bacterium]|nr:hypothetical protein [bacterium]
MFLAQKIDPNHFYTCGSTNLTFAGTFPYIISTIVLIIKIAVPILLIIFGMLDLGKAVVASKEDEIKKGQQLLIKRAITAVLVFFVIQIVQIIIRFVSGNNASVINCFNCFINGDSSTSACEITDND